jgi:hypothetical protein
MALAGLGSATGILTTQEQASASAVATLPHDPQTYAINFGTVASNPNALTGHTDSHTNAPLNVTATATFVELLPDPLAWEEWDLQVSRVSRVKALCIELYSKILPIHILERRHSGL